MSYKSLALAGTGLMVAGMDAAPAHAAAFYLQEQSVRAVGRAFSGEAADTGADSLWWNPAAGAGATQTTGALGAAAILPSGNVVDRGTLIVRPGQAPASVGGDPRAHDPINKGVLPHGSVNVPLNDMISVGLTITSPFSFETNYDADSWVRYTADKTRLRTFDIQPSLGVAPTSWLRLGVAANVEHSKATLSNALPNLLAALPDGEQQLKGSGWDVGWSAGAQVHTEQLTIGLSYKSSIRHTLDGSVTTSGLLGPLAGSNGSIDTKARFRTPWQAIGAVRFRVTPALTLNGQVVRFGWGKFDDIRLGAPLNVAIPEDYRNTWSFAGGVDYELTPLWTVRAGIQHDETPTRDGHRDARVPDASRWNFAVGTSYAITPMFTVDAAASYVDFKSASIDRTTAAYAGTPVQTPILVSGEIRNPNAVVLALGGRVAF